MILKMLETGPLMVNCYVVGDEDTGEAAVFDPGGDADRILSVLNEYGLRLKYILNTHTHWDHVGGNQALQEATGAPILTHRAEAAGLAQGGARAGAVIAGTAPSETVRFIQEGDVLEVGSIRFRVIDLRGHSPGGLGFVFEGEIEMEKGLRLARFVICGDALFAGSIGRTDFPGGDMEGLLRNIRDKIFTLPPDTLVLPGHGPVTTVEQEKSTNPFFRM
ncbi:MAG: MBL fold metallo-hydrolase [Deltaproteobacteria bacterium]|nr:MBL fold metallo-hydrolase [Deltaproteobacteria bacterium]MBW1924392.1 MBL fold metallo-hydrolase [Deltaproteobacteria bacterium]MBW1950682.1 MBL fold metallo-hydrolase [Deltaproteobacteria bacterium]MBW2008633.1 MBL fold metallo-hydrolase [Deltaproteobacteria bacterium]MBW2102754.1 MBL fold metallo-hydrolase [Deltaproteobacteria bacterium]